MRIFLIDDLIDERNIVYWAIMETFDVYIVFHYDNLPYVKSIWHSFSVATPFDRNPFK